MAKDGGQQHKQPKRSTTEEEVTEAKSTEEAAERKERLDEWEPHVKHYASSRVEAAGRAKLAKGAAAIWVRSMRR